MLIVNLTFKLQLLIANEKFFQVESLLKKEDELSPQQSALANNQQIFINCLNTTKV
jgi:hypothetical protein